MYRYFGVVGGPLELAAVVGVVVLTLVCAHRRRRWRLALVAAVLHAAALAVWLAVVLPANAEIGSWGAAVPADWQTWRNRWEIGHATRFGLLLPGFCTLVLALLGDERRQPAPDARDRSDSSELSAAPR